eukprot:CAMPEP_0197585696 /NCGR_PEP_ID=MMETSP1326-20131121/7918_1 /TAXON_ID=1155430 /ORGANISM="Genus nov. species nov., Strain RCC2288" /LENGTH=72 /DNA_ID=CAMNT_0043150239 /DNA_START=61 /DNA_END=279 /DNA_ORIENTATION=-
MAEQAPAKTKDIAVDLECDDEFEEFGNEEWGAEEEDAEDVNQWEEDWDDSDTNDDFTRQLRAELERVAQQGA